MGDEHQQHQPTSLEEKLHRWRETAREYARAKAEQEYLDHFRKSKLAILMKHYAVQGHKNANAQEREARADPAYLEILEGLKEATEIAERLYWELQINRAAIEIWRTKQANKRVERSSY